MRNDFRDVCEVQNEIAQVRHQRQPRRPHARVLCHDEDFREEAIDHRPQTGQLGERLSIVRRARRLLDAGPAGIELGEERQFGRLGQRLALERRMDFSSRAMFLTRLKRTASA